MQCRLHIGFLRFRERFRNVRSSSNRLFSIVWMALASVSFMAGQNTLPALAKGVTLEQKLNSPVPLDLTFRDEGNQVVPLRTYFGEKPVVLALVYYRCPNLCSLTLTEMVHSLRRVAFEPGRDYNVVVVSIDPLENAQLATATPSAAMAPPHTLDKAGPAGRALVAETPISQPSA